MDRLTTNIVPPEGPLDARICFIVQAPGKEEDESLKPLVGSAGQLMNRCLHTVGLVRSEILINNVFKQRPPKNNVGYYFVDKGCNKLTWEGQEHVEILENWLKKLLAVRESTGEGPNVLVAFGREAMMILTGHKRITKWRGSVLPCTLVPGFKVYCSFHPSFVNRLMNETREKLIGEKKKQQQNALPLFLKDLQRADEQSEFPEIRTPQREFAIANNFRDAMEQLNLCEQTKLLSVDIETLPSATGPIVWCIGFAPSPDKAYCIPIIKNHRLFWTIKEEAQIWRKISEIFLNPDIQKIFQGGSYDTSVLGRFYGLRCGNNTYQDTMLCHHSNHPYLRKGLDVLCSIYTWEPYYKDEGKVHYGKRSSDTAEFLYNCKDTTCTREILPVVLRDARELGSIVNYERTLSIFPAILAMQLRGVRIDMKKKVELGKDFSNRAFLAQQTLNALAEDEININSPKQITAFLYVTMGMPMQYAHRTKKPTTDKDAINRLLKKYHKKATRENQILKAIAEFKKFSKLASTYTSMEVDTDGRIHTSYSWISTFRLNSSESPFGGGGNLQNIPVRTEEGREIRRLFIPDEGLVFLAADQSQAEAREVAWLAGDKRLIELYETPGFDVHWTRAKEILRIPQNIPYNKKALFKSPLLEEEQVLEFYRRLGKTIVHAFNYKMGPRMLQTILIREGVYLPELTCKRLIQSTRNANPMTVSWQNRVGEEVKRTRVIVTPLGDRREFRGRMNEELVRSAIAFNPQCTVGRLTQLAQKEVHDKVLECEQLLNVHDETIVQCLSEDVPSVMRQIKSAFEIPHMVNGRELTIPCDFKMSEKSWGDLEDIEYIA